MQHMLRAGLIALLLVTITACGLFTLDPTPVPPPRTPLATVASPTLLPSTMPLSTTIEAPPAPATSDLPFPSPRVNPMPPPVFPMQLGEFSFEPAPTPEQPLLNALQQFGSATILYTTPNRELLLIDAATLQKVWITAPATGSPCGRNNDGFTQRGIWSPDGQRIAIECQGANDAITIVCILDLHTGRFQRLSANANAERRWISEHIGAWSPDSHSVVLQSIASDTNVMTFAIVDVQTGETIPLPALAMASPPIWSVDGRQLAFLGRQVDQAPLQLHLMEWQQGTLTPTYAIPLSPPTDATIRLSAWVDEHDIFGVRVGTEGQEFPIHIDTTRGTIQELTQHPGTLIWAPDRQHYLLQENPLNTPPLPWGIYRPDGSLVEMLPPANGKTCWMPNSTDKLSVIHGPDHYATIVLRSADGHEQPLWQAVGVELGQCASADGRFFTVTTLAGKDLLLNMQGQAILAVQVGGGAFLGAWRPEPHGW